MKISLKQFSLLACLLASISFCQTANSQSTDLQKIRISSFEAGQNSKDFFSILQPNEAVAIQNAEINSKGQAITRKGQALYQSDTGDTAFTGLGAYYFDGSTSYVVAASGSNVVRANGNTWSTINTGSLGNGFDTGFIQANGDLFSFSSNKTGWWDGSAWNTATTYPTSPPTATTAAWLGNYLFLAGNTSHPDWVYFSANLVPTSFPAQNIRKVNTGDGQAVVRLEPFKLYDLIVYKERSIFDIDITNDPAVNGFTVTPLTKDVGTPAKRSVVSLGNDQWFLSSPPYAVRALSRTPFDKILVDIQSRPIQDIFDGTADRTLNTTHVDLSAAILFDNKYILAIPTGSSAVNDFVVVYDFLTKSWWTIDGWYPKDWLVYAGNLYYTDANDGRVVKCFTGTVADFGSVHTSTSGPTVGIAYKYTTRGVDGGYPENFKQLDSVSLEFFPTGNWNATVELNLDNSGWVNVGTVNLLGNALTLPFTLPATLASEGLTVKTLQLTQYGEFKVAQIRVTNSDTNSPIKLQAVDLYFRIKPWRRE